MESKKKYAIIVFSIIFVCGLLLIMYSENLGEYFSRHYHHHGGWSVYRPDVIIKSVPYMVVGSIISLVSGFGLVLSILRK
ncbi:MAG: hypothetical protein GX076_01960 [Clostridiales bacterium]|nr:hypothetical protein [Clostridiales bacterium]